MVETEKTKVSRKVILPFVVRMDEHIKALNEIVSEMPNCSAKTTFETSMKNFNKKYQNYTSSSIVVTGEVLSEDEQKFLTEYREKKKEISTPPSNDRTEMEADNEETKPVKKGRGKK